MGARVGSVAEIMGRRVSREEFCTIFLAIGLELRWEDIRFSIFGSREGKAWIDFRVREREGRWGLDAMSFRVDEFEEFIR